jgi:multicomponent Na+:H+ antiporter subunit D
MSLLDQLPPLLVIVPLFGAILAALARKGPLAWGIAQIVAVAVLLIAAALLVQVYYVDTISYRIGGWAPDVGIEYRIDRINAPILLLVASIAAAIVPFAFRSVAAELPEERQAWFYAMFLLCLTGLLGIAITGDAFNAFVFLEISSLSTYTLIALGRNRRALIASYQYLIVGTIGATFYVIGVGLLYIMTGTLNLGLIAERLADIESARPVLAALAFIIVGISLKLALFPLHLWLPNAYAYAPSFATIFLAATATKVAVYLLARYIFGVFGIGFIATALPVNQVLLLLSTVAIVVAALVAVYEDNVKRMLAYSSVGQIGYITLGLAMATVSGVTGGYLHILAHGITKGALFAAVGAVFLRSGSARLGDFAGLGRRMPLTVGAFVVAGLSLVGIPGTVGFLSKWYLVLGAIELGWWWLAAIIVLSSLIAVIYLGRVVEVAFFREPVAATARATEAPPSMLLTLGILTAATIVFGLRTDLLAGSARAAASALLGATP